MTPTMIATVSSASVSASGVFAARRLPPSRHTARTRLFVVYSRRTPNSSDSDASRAARSPGGASPSDTDWMRAARKLANKRAAQFRQERGPPPGSAPASWRRKRDRRRGDDEGDDERTRGDSLSDSSDRAYREAARGYDDLRRANNARRPVGQGRLVAEDEEEMTAAAGDGLWRVDMDALGEADWATQWTMTDEEWRSVRAAAIETADSPSSALDRFEDAGLRRVSPDVAAGMLRVVAEKARASRADREALSGTRRDARFAHLLGTCVAAARRGSDALAPGSVADAAWALAAVAGERANAAEMEVLADRAAATADEMTPRQLANLAWALATCRHASAAYFRAMDVRFAGDDGLRGFKAFDVSTLAWAFAHLGHRADGFLDGLDRWFADGGEKGNKKNAAPSDPNAQIIPLADRDPALAAENSAEAAKRFAPQTLVSVAWSLAVLGEEATASRAFAACWRDVGARGATFAAAPEFAGVDPDADADRVALGPWRGKHLNQIHQIAVAVEEKEDALAAAVPAVVLEAAANAWTAQRRPPVVSWYQRDVASILSYMGERHEDEARCAGYRVDLLVPDPVGVDKGAFPGGVAVEVDGPSHFARNDAAVALGQTRLKRAQLRKLGFAVVSVPVAEWEYLETAEEKVEFLREGMQDAVRGR